MTNEEINEWFNALGAFLTENRLDWIKTAVDADIAEGIIEEVPPSELIFKEPSSGIVRSGRSTEEYLKLREYTDKEKLLAIIEAIEQTIIQASDLELYIVDGFIGEDRLDAIRFGGETQSHTLETDDIRARSRHEAAELARKLLIELRNEVNA